MADSPTFLGFCGYKVGMSHRYSIDDFRRSPTFGQEINNSVTFIETPPMIVCCIRAYSKTTNGLQTIMETWMENPLKKHDKWTFIPKNVDVESSLKKLEKHLSEIDELRGILTTQPQLINVSQKKPDLFEVKVDGGTIKGQFVYLKELLGKEVNVYDVFKEGQFIDVIAVTKGKGIQGPVKRWGVKKLPHKSRKTVRGVGTLGAKTPHYVMYTVPRAGQMGFHQRTELNKRILAIDEADESVNPKGGFHKYGIIRSNYMILKGSVPGPTKRLIKLRYASRPPKNIDAAYAEIKT
jgi:large subunit ribosomal protein L3